MVVTHPQLPKSIKLLSFEPSSTAQTFQINLQTAIFALNIVEHQKR